MNKIKSEEFISVKNDKETSKELKSLRETSKDLKSSGQKTNISKTFKLNAIEDISNINKIKEKLFSSKIKIL